MKAAPRAETKPYQDTKISPNLVASAPVPAQTTALNKADLLDEPVAIERKPSGGEFRRRGSQSVIEEENFKVKVNEAQVQLNTEMNRLRQETNQILKEQTDEIGFLGTVLDSYQKIHKKLQEENGYFSEELKKLTEEKNRMKAKLTAEVTKVSQEMTRLSNLNREFQSILTHVSKSLVDTQELVGKVSTQLTTMVPKLESDVQTALALMKRSDEMNVGSVEKKVLGQFVFGEAAEVGRKNSKGSDFHFDLPAKSVGTSPSEGRMTVDKETKSALLPEEVRPLSLRAETPQNKPFEEFKVVAVEEQTKAEVNEETIQEHVRAVPEEKHFEVSEEPQQQRQQSVEEEKISDQFKSVDQEHVQAPLNFDLDFKPQLAEVTPKAPEVQPNFDFGFDTKTPKAVTETQTLAPPAEEPKVELALEPENQFGVSDPFKTDKLPSNNEIKSPEDGNKNVFEGFTMDLQANFQGDWGNFDKSFGEGWDNSAGQKEQKRDSLDSNDFAKFNF
eukprot:TRINITY_DN5564_c0_g1_i5.p1 TRINITY_DN5564_c0_g1~~TRINITY_DN5564_c0_g1_i5.p1  ORF type:complete len:502 (+),score=155.92 TRINITY_DN5564_c0_g1_i5:1077-2582(+)